MVSDAHRYTPEVTGLHLGKPDVDDRGVVFASYLGDDLGFADAWWPPQHDGGMQAVKRTVEFLFEDFA
jgi:hypothetical protein